MSDVFKLVQPNVSDPNNIGEIFRELFFEKNGYGCYSTYDLIEGFNEIHSGQVFEETLNQLVDFEDRDYYKPVVYVNDQGWIVAWFWDGDGTLYFKVDDFELINNDCKKSTCWEWL